MPFLGSDKGQLISKGLFGTLEFLQKNERKNSFIVLLGQKNEFFRSFFGGIVDLKKPFRICLTFSKTG